ncbi:hypothetical protein Goarm_011084 [Gossypium armourianum]|uniref:Uncharacterized protein n=1 Tax=Gossypium armourianum TaxID=34283 RepID=A0A7J9IVR0_9ROSI|nr:hypothetical protein [Gossypium armourianum]
MARKFGNFIGTFLDYDTKSIKSGYRAFLWIHVRIDIRGILSGSNSSREKNDFPLEWDLTIRATSRLGSAATIENVNPNLSLGEEDALMEVRESKK